MRAASTLQLAEQFAAARNDGGVDVLMTLYETEAPSAPEPGEEVTGRDHVRGALEQFAAWIPAGGRLGGESTKVLIAADVALVRNRWTLDGTWPDGTAVETVVET